MDRVPAFLENVEQRRDSVSQDLADSARSEFGQFFTPHETARLLAQMVEVTDRPWRLLDPGAGVGSLSAALIARWLTETDIPEMDVVAYEVDPTLIAPLERTLDEAKGLAASKGRTLKAQIVQTDFILDPPQDAEITTVLMNPPYRKLGVHSRERTALESADSPIRVTNLYAAFLVRAVRALATGGQLVAITPRSFANGPYFRELRRDLLTRASFDHIHVFEARNRVFADSDVLQENLIFSMHAGRSPGRVVVSSSADASSNSSSWTCDHAEIVHPHDDARFVRLPLDREALLVAEQMLAMPSSLDDLAIEVSTGRVVDFRAREHLRQLPEEDASPLIYPQNVQEGRVRWPVTGRKPQALAAVKETSALLLPNEHYVVVKRFSAKEEKRRVVAALSEPDAYGGAETVGFENHLNVFHASGHGLDPAVAAGLVDYLNSPFVDAFIRQFNGHTQINATDLRALRYPSIEQLRGYEDELNELIAA